MLRFLRREVAIHTFLNKGVGIQISRSPTRPELINSLLYLLDFGAERFHVLTEVRARWHNAELTFGRPEYRPLDDRVHASLKLSQVYIFQGGLEEVVYRLSLLLIQAIEAGLQRRKPLLQAVHRLHQCGVRLLHRFQPGQAA